MELSGLLVLSWIATAPVEPAGFGYCNFTECSFSGSTPAAQYGNLAACLTGPVVQTGPLCSCADLDGDGYVSLRDFAAFQVAPLHVCSRYIEVRQEPGLGFCPTPGTVYRANVIYTLNGSLLLVGSLIDEGDSEVDRCIPGFTFPLSCYVAKPFLPRRLTSLERSELSALVQNIPQEGCQRECTNPCVGLCCFIIDPCVIWYVGRHNDYCYGLGNSDEYRHAIQAVAAYVADLAMNNPP